MPITPDNCNSEPLCILGSTNNCLTITLDGDGSYSRPFSIIGNLHIGNSLLCTPSGLEVCIDPKGDNQLSRTETGCLYVQPPQFFQPSPCDHPSGCIDVKVLGTGCEGDPFRVLADPIINPSCDLLVCTDTGLCVLAPEFSVVSNNCIDISLDGMGTVADPWVLEVSTVLNPSASNAITCTQQGLYAHEYLNGTETATITTAITGDGTSTVPHVVTSSVKVDPYTGNRLTVTQNGLRVEGVGKTSATVVAQANTPTVFVHNFNLASGNEKDFIVQAYDVGTHLPVQLKVSNWTQNTFTFESPVSASALHIVVIG